MDTNFAFVIRLFVNFALLITFTTMGAISIKNFWQEGGEALAVGIYVACSIVHAIIINGMFAKK